MKRLNDKAQSDQDAAVSNDDDDDTDTRTEIQILQEQLEVKKLEAEHAQVESARNFADLAVMSTLYKGVQDSFHTALCTIEKLKKDVEAKDTRITALVAEMDKVKHDCAHGYILSKFSTSASFQDLTIDELRVCRFSNFFFFLSTPHLSFSLQAAVNALLAKEAQSTDERRVLSAENAQLTEEVSRCRGFVAGMSQSQPKGDHGANNKIRKFMFVYSGPDFNPVVTDDYIRSTESGVYNDGDLKYCVVTLFANNGRRQHSLKNVVLEYNLRVGADKQVIMVSVADSSGKELPMIIPYTRGKSGNNPIWTKCCFDRQQSHPAFRAWENPGVSGGTGVPKP